MTKLIKNLSTAKSHAGDCPSHIHPSLWTNENTPMIIRIYGQTEESTWDLSSDGRTIEDIDGYYQSSTITFMIDNSADCAGLGRGNAECYEWHFHFYDMSQSCLFTIIRQLIKEQGSVFGAIHWLRCELLSQLEENERRDTQQMIHQLTQ